MMARTLRTALIATCLAAWTCACAACSATNARGADTGLTHETRVEHPGRTVERTTKLRISPRENAAPHSTTATPEKGVSSDAPATPERISDAALLDEAPSAAHQRTAGGWGALVLASSEQPIDPSVQRLIDEARRSGSTVDLELTERETVPLAADEQRSTFDQAGPALRTNSAEAAVKFNGKTGDIDLPWGGSASGGRLGVSAELLSGSGVNVLFLIGGLVMLAAIVPVLIPPRRVKTAAVIFGVGLAIVAVGVVAQRYPWVMLIGVILFAALLGYWVYVTWRTGRLRAAFDHVVGAVQLHSGTPDNPEGPGRLIRAQIAESAGDETVTKVIDPEVEAAKKRNARHG